MPKYRVVRSLEGKSVIFTGKLLVNGELMTRSEASRRAEQAGAKPGAQRSRVTRNTDILVRGISDQWSSGAYGRDEEDVARLQAQGFGIVIIDGEGFSSLLQGGWAYTISPHKDAVALPVGAAPYRPATASGRRARRPFEIDPDVLDRGLAGHVETQNALAEAALRAGLDPLSPTRGDCLFDLAWMEGDTFVVCEVKSLHERNEVHQLRLGLGQVLDYMSRIARSHQVRGVLAVERIPSEVDHWVRLCKMHDVTLAWPDFDRIF